MRGSNLSHMSERSHPNQDYLPTPELKHDNPELEQKKKKAKALKERVQSFRQEDPEPVSPSKISPQKVTLAEVIKNRGRVIDLKRKNANFMRGMRASAGRLGRT